MSLTDEELQALIEERRAVPQAEYTYVRPFARAADELIDVVQNAEGRWLFGIPDIDTRVRGVGRGELMYVTGEAHSGKTQVVLQSVVNNPGARVVIFTPDEVDTLILMKLVGITHGVNAEILEQQIRAGSETYVEMVRTVAASTFANLIVVDDALGFEAMSVALAEAEHHWGAPADCVIVDFLELLPGSADTDGVQSKSQDLKRWTKNHDVPMICIHQASRSSGKRGQARGMRAMRYGGENDAIFVLEVFRKAEDEELEEVERERLKNTVTVNIAKNKRPPSRKGQFDLYLDPECGLVRPIRPEDIVIQRGPARVMAIQQARAEVEDREVEDD